MGFTFNFPERLQQHLEGRGARLLAVVVKAGITVELARTWEGTRSDERRRKKMKMAARLCPICQEKAKSLKNAKRQKGEA